MAYDLEIQQGANYYLTLGITDASGNAQDLSNCLVSGLIKTHYGDFSGLCSLNASIISPSSGVISLSISSSNTSQLPVNFLFYDINLYNINTSGTSKILYGKAIVSPQITF